MYLFNLSFVQRLALTIALQVLLFVMLIGLV